MELFAKKLAYRVESQPGDGNYSILAVLTNKIEGGATVYVVYRGLGIQGWEKSIMFFESIEKALRIFVPAPYWFRQLPQTLQVEENWGPTTDWLHQVAVGDEVATKRGNVCEDMTGIWMSVSIPTEQEIITAKLEREPSESTKQLARLFEGLSANSLGR